MRVRHPPLAVALAWWSVSVPVPGHAQTSPGRDSLEFVAVGAGGYHSCALTRTGTAYCWGFGRLGALGRGDTASSAVPLPVAGAYRFVTVVTGRFHTCALTADSAAYCWGDNSYGQLGNDSVGETCTSRDPFEQPFACSTRARTVAGGHHYATLTAGGVHACGVTATGAAYCWGFNGAGALGSRAAQDVTSVPVVVDGNLTFAVVSGGLNHSCGVTTAGALYCWGSNADNQLGNAAVRGAPGPVPVARGVTFVSVTAGGAHTCAVGADTTAYCWGAFEHGRLGIGESVAENLLLKMHQAQPALVAGGLKFRSVSAGGVHTCGVTTTAMAYCWGDNLDGRLGVGGNLLSSAKWKTKPSAVEGGLTFTMVSAGDYHSCGLTTDGAVYCWGRNDEGQLGDGTMKSSVRPVRIKVPPPAAAPDSSR